MYIYLNKVSSILKELQLFLWCDLNYQHRWPGLPTRRSKWVSTSEFLRHLSFTEKWMFLNESTINGYRGEYSVLLHRTSLFEQVQGILQVFQKSGPDYQQVVYVLSRRFLKWALFHAPCWTLIISGIIRTWGYKGLNDSHRQPNSDLAQLIEI